MPANLSPEYEKAEQRYREAADDAERLETLREMLRTIPKHKGTEKMQADIKRRMGQLRKNQAKGSATSKGPDPFHIPKSGAGQVVLIGPPNTGKSSLLAVTTHAEPKVADYPFTTGLPQPGIWYRNDIPIELVDTPPLCPDHIPTGLMGTIRAADVLCLFVDASANPLEQVEGLLGVLRERGLQLRSLPRNELNPADPTQRTSLIVLNKMDQAPPGTSESLSELYAGQLETQAISVRAGAGLEGLFDRLWRLLAMIRVYSKEPGRPADMQKPFTLRIGATVADLARHIHRDLPETMKHARIWGPGRHEGQLIHKTEVLQDKEIVEIHG